MSDIYSTDDFVAFVLNTTYDFPEGCSPAFWTGDLARIIVNDNPTLFSMARHTKVLAFTSNITIWNEDIRSIWVAASKHYAESVAALYGHDGQLAGKEVYSFVSPCSNPLSIYFQIERPILFQEGVNLLERFL